MSIDVSRIVWIDYINHRGERRWRRVYPQFFWFGLSPHHAGAQAWFMEALDLERPEAEDRRRSFKLEDVRAWSITTPEPEGRPPPPAADAPCVWCGQPPAAHGAPGGSSLYPEGRLCQGKSTQFYAAREEAS